MRRCPGGPLPTLMVLVVLLLTPFPAAAHHVSYQVTRGEAVVVTLAYGDGTPLVLERYDIFAGDQPNPYQSGRTDGEGRIVFLPDRQGDWRVRVFTEDGHGADFTLEAGPADTENAETGRPLVERFAGPVLGVGIILTVFGLLTLFTRRRQ